MERYEDFLMRVSAFEVAEIDLGKSYFRGRASLGDKIDGENRLKPFYGDTVVFDLDEAVKNRISHIVDKLYSAAGDCLAERLSGSTLHMTLHDLSNGGNLDLLRGKMAENEENTRIVFGTQIVYNAKIGGKNKLLLLCNNFWSDNDKTCNRRIWQSWEGVGAYCSF